MGHFGETNNKLDFIALLLQPHENCHEATDISDALVMNHMKCCEQCLRGNICDRLGSRLKGMKASDYIRSPIQQKAHICCSGESEHNVYRVVYDTVSELYPV